MTMTIHDTSQPKSAGEWRKRDDGTWYFVPHFPGGTGGGEQGERGPAGPAGPQGPPGSGGTGGDAHYVHTQSLLAKVWTVNHNLGKHPAVAITDAAGSVLFADVKYVDADSLTVTFQNTATGTVYCN